MTAVALLSAPKHAAAFDERSKAILDCLQQYGFIKSDNLCERLILGRRSRASATSSSKYAKKGYGVSVIATALKHMLADGMDSDAIVAAVAEMEREMTPGADRTAEKRREWDREGMRKQRNCALSGGTGGNRVGAETLSFPESAETLTNKSPEIDRSPEVMARVRARLN